ncbi:Heat shock protein DnaJ [Venturia nashicola]|nr:Heat shock protein DnaJ [Venturia nashicola]
MVKADAKQNYYEDLQVPPNATTEDIKKQYRTLARLYHPDRNPGKEVEFNAKFQCIQAAHEILTDPDQRRAYDNERRKSGYGGIRAQSAYAGTHREQTAYGGSAFANGRSPYATYSNFAPPPRRNPAPTAKPKATPLYTHGTGPSPGAARAANFARPPRTTAQGGFASTKDDSDREARAEREARASAWERMRASGNHQPSGWSDGDFERRPRPTPAEPLNKPGFGRSNTAKPFKKGGFDPNAMDGGDWEPQAPSYTSYRPVPPMPTASKPQPPPVPSRSPQPAPPPPPRTNAEPANMFRAASGEEDVPFTEGARLRTPYTSHSGERTPFSNNESARRTASAREGTPISGTSTSNRTSPRGANGRPRSHSPSGRTTASNDAQYSPQPMPRKTSDTQPRRKIVPDYDFSSDSSSGESSTSSGTSAKENSGGTALGNRARAQPSKFWDQKRSDSPLKDQVPGSRTAPDTPLDGQSKPQMYDKSIPFFPRVPGFENFGSAPNLAKRTPQQPPKHGMWGGWAPWAIPSSVSPNDKSKPSPERKQSRFFPDSAYHTPRPANAREQSIPYTSPTPYSFQHENVTDHVSSFRFDIPKGYDTEPPSGFKSPSTDNISTKFNQSDWEGRFEGSKNFMPPPPQPARKGSKSTPLKRVSGQANGVNPLGSQNNPIDITSPAGMKIPPPPPMPPSSNGLPASSNSAPPRPVKFSSEEWAKTLKEQTFFLPTDRPTSPSKAGSSSTRRQRNSVRGKKPSRVATNGPAPPSAAISDASDEDSETQPVKPKSSAHHHRVVEPEAMDIDSEIPGAFGAISPDITKGPRLVNVPAARPEWRDGHAETTAAVPAAAHGRVPSGSIPTTVPNAAIPPPPPMPPPPPKTTAKKAKVKRESLNLNDLKHVTPFGPSGSEGLHGFSDLTGNLPFQSQPSIHPVRTFEPRELELPAPPKAPTSPLTTTSARLTETQWREYVAAMSYYMGKCVFGTGSPSISATQALEATGEGSAEPGFLSYLKGLEEDVRVRKHWDIACERHRVVMQEFAKVKEGVKMKGLA